MEVSESGSKGRERGEVELQIGVICAESVKTLSRLTLSAPVFQVRSTVRLERKSFQPLFVVLLGPSGCTRVAVDT